MNTVCFMFPLVLTLAKKLHIYSLLTRIVEGTYTLLYLGKSH